MPTSEIALLLLFQNVNLQIALQGLRNVKDESRIKTAMLPVVLIGTTLSGFMVTFLFIYFKKGCSSLRLDSNS